MGLLEAVDKPVAALPANDMEWQCIEVTMDSGAAVNAITEEDAEGFEETEVQNPQSYNFPGHWMLYCRVPFRLVSVIRRLTFFVIVCGLHKACIGELSS